MNIYVELNGRSIWAYESDTVPRVGETISRADVRKSWRVIAVDHLIREISRDLKLELVTVCVERIK